MEPEWLDGLCPEDRLALENRADLRHLNRVAGTVAWFEAAMEQVGRVGEPWLEVGAGDGELALALRRQGWKVDGLDVVEAAGGWPKEAKWYRQPVEDFRGWDDYHGMMVNLLLHQLTDEALGRLGQRLMEGGVRAVVAQEPWRSAWAQGMFLLASSLLGMGEVSRHDGWVSIGGGFDGEELPGLLGLEREVWEWRVELSRLGWYRLVAWRKA